MGVIRTWVIVPIKDFDSAKERLRPALGTRSRRALARRNARLAVSAAAAGDHVLVVAGSEEVAEMATSWGAEALLEPREEGQNTAAERGIAHAVRAGAEAVLLLSSDLPLVTRDGVRQVLQVAGKHASPVVVAVPAIGRGGTNALYLHPPDAVAMHFGEDSLAKFREDAEGRGIKFVIHRSDAIALDLDEPSDLERLTPAV
ncbi:MAG TPA: 2-phospho-L-lactate guanylyltransferase [Candidatus Dormibacteraeota bacterium]|nr:2-phospho-L-lactate guanylyltransferase [Candidatus Dormibacteraeota bacterium]